MTKEELQLTTFRLSMMKDFNDSIEVIDIFMEHMFNVIEFNSPKTVDSYPTRDAITINQMMFTKLTHLRKLMEGVGYLSNSGTKMNPIIDPTIIASLVRNIYETVSLFNLIFINTKTEDEKLVLYYLWVSSGLKYRQRFESLATGQENQEKLRSEKEQIAKIEIKIKGLELYKSLDPKNQGKIDYAIRKKDYKLKFEGTEVKNLSWQDMSDVMGLRKDLFDNIYNYFSLYAHPSQVATFQFLDMFSKENEEFKQLTILNLRYCFSLVSIFIADYISIFPPVKATFEKLELYKQIVINAHNKSLRGDEFSINDSWKKLG